MRRTHRSIPLGLCLALSMSAALAEPTVAAPATEPAPATEAKSTDKLERVTGEQAAADKAAADSQQRINSVDDDTQKMLVEYRRALADAESQDAYSAQLTKQVSSQNVELADLQRQLDEVEDTARSITPLQQKMLATLHEFVQLDVPFLLEERSKRVANLQSMMDRADVSISEKYRRIVEAYQVELDYGRTIESYEGRLDDQGSSRTARFLRVGRVSLLYQTLDGQETGYWNATDRSWVRDDHYSHSFKLGIAVAQKTSAPEMLLVPVPAPTEERS